jgi:aldehyde:ferredoxin oxidoreductase
MLEQIVRRQGFGDLLADGVARAAEHIGQGSERYAVHIGGQEPGFLNPRMSPFRGLDEISNATPGRHMPPGASIRLESEGVLGPYTEITAPNDEDEYERRGKIHAIGSAYSQIFSDSGLCLFANSGGSHFPLVEFIGAVTGWDFTIAEAITTGKRILTLRQAFNFREGVRPNDFSLPDRIPTPPTGGSFLGRNIDFEKLRASYYKAMGWDAESGCPSQKCLMELGLGELVGALSQT